MDDEQKQKHATRAAELVREAIKIADEAGLDLVAAHLQAVLEIIDQNAERS